MSDYIADPGLLGVGFGIRKVVSDVEGFFGFGFSKNTNAVFFVQNMVGQPLQGNTISVSWPGGSDSIVNYDPTVLYERNYPTDTPLTVSTPATDRYEAVSYQITIPSGGFRRLDVIPAFVQSYFRITKKRYL
jgi:hypothetical protein